MAHAWEQQIIAIAAFVAINSYAGGLICAAWIRPELRRFFIFRPRWGHGPHASPVGMTAQAAVILSFSLMIGSRLVDLDMRYAFWLFLLSGCFSLGAWAHDVANDKDRR